MGLYDDFKKWATKTGVDADEWMKSRLGFGAADTGKFLWNQSVPGMINNATRAGYSAIGNLYNNPVQETVNAYKDYKNIYDKTSGAVGEYIDGVVSGIDAINNPVAITPGRGAGNWNDGTNRYGPGDMSAGVMESTPPQRNISAGPTAPKTFINKTDAGYVTPGYMGANWNAEGMNYKDWVKKTNEALAGFRGSTGKMSPGRAAQEAKSNTPEKQLEKAFRKNPALVMQQMKAQTDIEIEKIRAQGATEEQVMTFNTRRQEEALKSFQKDADKGKLLAHEKRTSEDINSGVQMWKNATPDQKKAIEAKWGDLFDLMDKGADVKDDPRYKAFQADIALRTWAELSDPATQAGV